MKTKEQLLIKEYRNIGLGMFLAGVFGSIGLLYSSIIFAVVIFISEFIVGYLIANHIDEVNSQIVWRILKINPIYDLKGYLILIFGIRCTAIFLSYISINSHNGKLKNQIEEVEFKETEIGKSEKQNEVEILTPTSDEKEMGNNPIVAIVFIGFFLISIVGIIWIYMNA